MRDPIILGSRFGALIVENSHVDVTACWAI